MVRRFIIAGLSGLASLVVCIAASAEWTQGERMMSTRTEVAVAAVGNRIYVAGGFGGAENLEIYDPNTDRWRLGASVPQRLHHAAAVA
ncbi:MAG: hypothetical protein GTO41_09195, partial [Burkholderiales bacterium]|nr:hypothetical protein [Burkholderiales bacterium]